MSDRREKPEKKPSDDVFAPLAKLLTLNFGRNSETGRYEKGTPTEGLLDKLVEINETLADQSTTLTNILQAIQSGGPGPGKSSADQKEVFAKLTQDLHTDQSHLMGGFEALGALLSGDFGGLEGVISKIDKGLKVEVTNWPTNLADQSKTSSIPVLSPLLGVVKHLNPEKWISSLKGVFAEKALPVRVTNWAESGTGDSLGNRAKAPDSTLSKIIPFFETGKWLGAATANLLFGKSQEQKAPEKIDVILVALADVVAELEQINGNTLISNLNEETMIGQLAVVIDNLMAANGQMATQAQLGVVIDELMAANGQLAAIHEELAASGFKPLEDESVPFPELDNLPAIDLVAVRDKLAEIYEELKGFRQDMVELLVPVAKLDTTVVEPTEVMSPPDLDPLIDILSTVNDIYSVMLNITEPITLKLDEVIAGEAALLQAIVDVLATVNGIYSSQLSSATLEEAGIQPKTGATLEEAGLQLPEQATQQQYSFPNITDAFVALTELKDVLANLGRQVEANTARMAALQEVQQATASAPDLAELITALRGQQQHAVAGSQNVAGDSTQGQFLPNTIAGVALEINKLGAVMASKLDAVIALLEQVKISFIGFTASFSTTTTTTTTLDITPIMTILTDIKNHMAQTPTDAILNDIRSILERWDSQGGIGGPGGGDDDGGGGDDEDEGPSPRTPKRRIVRGGEEGPSGGGRRGFAPLDDLFHGLGDGGPSFGLMKKPEKEEEEPEKEGEAEPSPGKKGGGRKGMIDLSALAGLGGVVASIASAIGVAIPLFGTLAAEVAALDLALAPTLAIVIPLFIGLGAALVPLIALFAALVAALVIFKTVTDWVVNGLNSLVTGVISAGADIANGFNDFLGKLASGDFFGALGVAATSVVKSFEDLTTGVTGAIPLIGGFLSGIISTFTGAIQTAVNALTGFASQMIPFVQALSPSTVEQFNRQMENLKATIGVAFEGFIGQVSEVINKVGGILLPVAEELRPVFDELGSIFRQSVLPAFKVLAALIGTLIEPIRSSLAGLRSVITETIKAFVILAASVSRLFGISDFVDRLREGIVRPEGGGATAAGPASVGDFASIAREVTIAAAQASVSNGRAAEVQTTEDILRSILSELDDIADLDFDALIDKIVDKVTDFFDTTIVPQVEAARDAVTGWANSQLGQLITTAMTAALDSLQRWLEARFRAVTGGGLPTYQEAQSIGRTFANDPRTFLRELFR